MRFHEPQLLRCCGSCFFSKINENNNDDNNNNRQLPTYLILQAVVSAGFFVLYLDTDVLLYREPFQDLLQRDRRGHGGQMGQGGSNGTAVEWFDLWIQSDRADLVILDPFDRTGYSKFCTTQMLTSMPLETTVTHESANLPTRITSPVNCFNRIPLCYVRAGASRTANSPQPRAGTVQRGAPPRPYTSCRCLRPRPRNYGPSARRHGRGQPLTLRQPSDL